MADVPDEIPMPSQTHAPGPVPMRVSWGCANTSVGPKIYLRFGTPIGDNTFFIEPDLADRLAIEFPKLAWQARTGMIIPGQG